MVRAEGRDELIGSVSDVQRHVVPIDTSERALQYTELLRRVGALADTEFGQLLELRSSSSGRGGFTAEDARAWGVPAETLVETAGDGFDIRRIVVTVPESLQSGTSSKVVELSEHVTRSGGYSGRITRVLADGDAARQFAVLPR